MKASLLMIAALMGTAAVAQTTPDAAAPAPAATDATAPVTTDASAAPAPAAMPATTDAGAATAAADTSNYPVCSRTVTDKCVQRGAWHKGHKHA